jgi:serine/threonine-protein kinase
MGTVYEAVRADEQFTKRVAIKTLRVGLTSADLAGRFTRERQIHAALTHPNIATLLDAGVTEDGVPYIVLEYVDGLPIDEYCAGNRLGLRARLDLFRQVIRAVDHAHRQLVVHRDLKPSNILVGSDGVVKLLDFGISKLISDAADHGVTQGERAFTTAYASPEQIRGEPISTATDVYSLGVVLYGLLTGRHPFDIKDSTPAQAWDTIVKEPPPPPSTVATAEAAATMEFETVPRLSRALKGELDAIVLMALRKEPDRRYRSVEALEEDLQRYLRGLPVQARPDSAGYRLRKLVGRNRLATAASVLAVIALVGGTAISLSQAREARAGQAIAERERRTALRVSGFLQDIIASADPTVDGRGFGPEATLMQAVDAAAARVDRVLGDDPEVALELHGRLAVTYIQLRRTDKAAYHSRRQVELSKQLNVPPLRIVQSLSNLGTHLRNSGRPDSALQYLQEAYALLERAGFPAGREAATALSELGLCLWAVGRPKEAIPILIQAVAGSQQVKADTLTAIITSNLGNARYAVGDVDGALAAYRQSEGILGSFTGREMIEQAAILNNLTTVLILRGDFVEAERSIRKAIGILERRLGPSSDRTATSRIHLARIELATGRATQALETIRGAAAMLGHLPPESQDRAREESYEAAILQALGRLPEAETLARRALATRRKVGTPTDWRIAETEAILGRILLARGQREEALTLLQRSHQSLRASMGDQHPLTVGVARDLAAIR